MTLPSRVSATVALSVALAAPARCGEIVGYTPETYARFTSGFPAAPVQNTSASFVASGLDVTGVGWRAAGNWGTTLVTPRHVVTTVHVGYFAPGEQVRFVGADGVVRSYPVAVNATTGQVVQTRLTTHYTDGTGATVTRPSDFLVVTLASPIPAADQITPLGVGAGSAPVGTNLLAYGQNSAYGSGTRHFGTNTLDALELVSIDGFASEATWTAMYDYTRTRPGDIALIGGDSGSPLLTRQGNTPVLLGTHYAVDGNLGDPNSPYLSYSAYLPYYLDELSGIVAADGQSLTVVPVPEPAGLGALAAILAVWGWRRLGAPGRGVG